MCTHSLQGGDSIIKVGEGGMKFMLFLRIDIYQSLKRWGITISWNKKENLQALFKKPFLLINDKKFYHRLNLKSNTVCKIFVNI